MIKYINSFLTNDECEYFTTLFDSNYSFNDDEVYKFYYINLMSKEIIIDKFKNFNFTKFRVQMVNETIDQINKPHGHLKPWSFIVFLNEDFTGGEVVFDDKVFVPKKGDMIYFTGDELHSVNNCVGNRYTLIGFMTNNPLRINDNKNLI